ncbi:MAG: L-ribulose-5-phosphate 4-epimerase AraD [Verrucomicrobiales bacterium]
MTLDDLKEEVFKANLLLDTAGLVKLTWGNVSGLDRSRGLMVIKPSGVAYEELTPDIMVVVSLADGAAIEGSLRPSSDTPSHLELYRAFDGIAGICHSHSVHATMFAQAGRELPCMGTTHADHFHGSVPVCRALTPAEAAADYEGHTGRAIVELFRAQNLDPSAMPAVLQAYHAPFTWGKTPLEAVRNNMALEICAQMALGTWFLNPTALPLPDHLLQKHHLRKHGPQAYYGQK